MKLSSYAKQLGISYTTACTTAWRWWRDGKLAGYQTELANQDREEQVAFYARVSSLDQRPDLDRQIQRLRDYASVKGLQVNIFVINQSDTQNELVDDFIAVMTSMCTRIYGRRNAKRKASQELH